MHEFAFVHPKAVATWPLIFVIVPVNGVVLTRHTGRAGTWALGPLLGPEVGVGGDRKVDAWAAEGRVDHMMDRVDARSEDIQPTNVGKVEGQCGVYQDTCIIETCVQSVIYVVVFQDFFDR